MQLGGRYFGQRRNLGVFIWQKKVLNMFLDYPHELTDEQKAIFDKENPYWADFFKKKTFHK